MRNHCGNHSYLQSSTRNPGTRMNSFPLLVTSVAPKLSAWATVKLGCWEVVLVAKLERSGACAPTELSGYGFAPKTITCMEPFSLVGTITRRVFGS